MKKIINLLIVIVFIIFMLSLFSLFNGSLELLPTEEQIEKTEIVSIIFLIISFLIEVILIFIRTKIKKC